MDIVFSALIKILDAGILGAIEFAKLRAAASQNQAFTPEQDAALDARAEEVFASDASDPDKNK